MKSRALDLKAKSKPKTLTSDPTKMIPGGDGQTFTAKIYIHIDMIVFLVCLIEESIRKVMFRIDQSAFMAIADLFSL